LLNRRRIAAVAEPAIGHAQLQPACARDWFVCLLCRRLATRVPPRRAQSVDEGFTQRLVDKQAHG
jgi:hypothetical protein